MFCFKQLDCQISVSMLSEYDGFLKKNLELKFCLLNRRMYLCCLGTTFNENILARYTPYKTVCYIKYLNIHGEQTRPIPSSKDVSTVTHIPPIYNTVINFPCPYKAYCYRSHHKINSEIHSYYLKSTQIRQPTP